MARIYLVSVIVFVACQSEYGTDFEIINSSSSIIDSVTVSTVNYESTLKIENLAQGVVYSDLLDMKYIDRIDGHFKLAVYSDTLSRRLNFGYYTNGMREESTINIEIQLDTVIINYKRNNWIF